MAVVVRLRECPQQLVEALDEVVKHRFDGCHIGKSGAVMIGSD
jgi:hypothetical protein